MNKQIYLVLALILSTCFGLVSCYQDCPDDGGDPNKKGPSKEDTIPMGEYTPCLLYTSGSQHNVRSFDLTHRSELFTLSKNGPNRSVHGPIDESDADYHYLEEIPRETDMYRHATEGVVGYSYHWGESMVKLQGGIRSHIFAHTPTQQKLCLLYTSRCV